MQARKVSHKYEMYDKEYCTLDMKSSHQNSKVIIKNNLENLVVNYQN